MMRAAAPTDCRLLGVIHRAAFGPGQGWSADFLGRQMALPGTLGIVDENNGFILVRCVMDQAEILTLAVAPEAQRRGIGSQLLTMSMARAANLGGRAMFLEVSEGNIPARALYQAHGFTQIGTRPRYYEDGATALVMSRPLDPGTG